ncbi:secretogranin-1 [Sorex araneus]|uniref:secretogranin-1 n=1 Tax=Sorex araneus TaxID=42254 RepID=UPI00064A08B2|nr:secretogranin-1 [Sorex araneus]
MHPAVLLGLLGAAAVIGSMPVDNGNHNEEMVTRCIIEVLSNALSKSNAPPITPECRQILKKSGKEVKDEEKVGNENTRFEVRLLRDHVDAPEAGGPPGREEADLPQKEDPKDPAMSTEREGGGHSHERAGTPHKSLHPDVNSPVSKEAVTHHSEPSSGEDRAKEPEKHPKGEPEEDASQEAPAETQGTLLHTRNPASSKGKADAASPSDGTHSSERSEERTHSRERSGQESREDPGSFEKFPQAPGSQAGRQQESEESEEEVASPDVDKRRLRHHHARTRPDGPSQEGSPATKERDRPREAVEESNVGWAGFGDRQDRHSSHYREFQEEPEYGGRAGSSPAVRAPEDVAVAHHRGRGSEESREADPSSQEEEDEEEEEEEQRNRPGLELDNMAQGYSEESKEERGWEWGPHPRAKGGQSGASNKEDKRFLTGGYRQLGENQLDQARRYPQGEWDEQDRNDLGYGQGRGEEGGWGRWQQPEYPQESKKTEEARLSGQRSAPRYTSEDRKRLGALLSSYFGPSQWKNSHFERKDDVDAGFPEGEEDRLAVNEKSFFPEYNYDWWEKKPFEDDVNWGYEKRSFAPRLDLKRQYDRVAELDQLLHYRKKAAEFPDFYDSEEPMSLRQAAESEGDRAGQGVLTEEEEKELENLAAMDLELQKIARKFSGNRGG